MFNSLTTQHLIQTPDYHLFTIKVGCISGCVSGIAPVLKLGQRVLVDTSIIRQLKPLIYQDFTSKVPSFCFVIPKCLSSGVSPDVCTARLRVKSSGATTSLF